jgi:cytidylate kinase
VIALARGEGEAAAPVPVVPRALTLARQLGAGDTGFAPTLAGRLGLRVYDRELLEQEAARLGVSAAELETVDEQPPGLLGRLRPGGLPGRYLEMMGQLMGELAARGDALLVGRGGSRLLRDRPGVFHVRLVAALPVRVRRVMEYRWLRESAARQLIADSDGRRARFYATAFGADWASPLERHLTVNTGRLGSAAVDVVALAAGRHWSRSHG